jgi:hypothetical protein
MKNTILLLLFGIFSLASCEGQREAAREYRETTSLGYFDGEAMESPAPNTVSKYPARKMSGAYGNGNAIDSDGDGIADKFEQTGNASTAKDTTLANRLIQYNAQLNLAVKRPDTAISKCKAIALKYEGYAQTISTSRAVIRVKSERLNEALTELAALGEVNYKNVYADDVTEQYYDWKIRLENMEKARKRYLELLDKAANVQETLLVEKELERLNGEIDAMKGKISRMQHLVAYSTITVNVHEKVKPGILGYPFVWLFKGVKWLFVRN